MKKLFVCFQTSPYFQTVKPLMPKLSSSDEKVSKSAVAGDSALLETDKNLSGKISRCLQAKLFK
jgi:hypothetical protein